MKIINYTLLGLFLLFLTGCSGEEETLEPSGKDENRVEALIDRSIPEVDSWYNNYNLGALYEYDNILDFAYVAGSKAQADKYAAIEIPELQTLFVDSDGNMSAANEVLYKEYVQGAMTFLDTTVFKYFDANSKIASLMPYKVLVSASVFSSVTIGGSASTVLTESEARFSSQSTNSLRAIYNDNSIVLTYDKDNIARNINAYKLDYFYIMLCRIMEMHNLYDEVPAEFFTGKDDYYNQGMEDIYREENDIDEELYVYVIDKDWFYSKGFVDATYFYATTGLRTYVQRNDEYGNPLPAMIIHPKALLASYDFVSDPAEDVRSYINEMMFRNATELEAFPDNIKDNFRILLNFFDDLGVDIRSINPDLAVLN